MRYVPSAFCRFAPDLPDLPVSATTFARGMHGVLTSEWADGRAAHGFPSFNGAVARRTQDLGPFVAIDPSHLCDISQRRCARLACSGWISA
jgi:hypothetical protein